MTTMGGEWKAQLVLNAGLLIAADGLQLGDAGLETSQYISKDIREPEQAQKKHTKTADTHSDHHSNGVTVKEYPNPLRSIFKMSFIMF